MELTLPVTLAVLGAALLHASWNALLKGSADKQLDTVAISVGAGIVGLAVAVFLPPPAREAWPWLAASASVHILYFALLAGAYQWGELSYAYPIMRGGGPVVVALAGSAVFAESLVPRQWAGVALVCGGIAAFAYGRHDRRATFFALGNALVIAAYTIIDAKGARASGSPVAYTMWFFVLNALVIYAYAGLRRGREVPRYLAHGWRRILVGALFTTGSYAIALWAMTRAPVALVAVLRETAVLFGAALGALFLGEKMTRRRLAATGAVLAGLVALKL
ncbi:MAG: EamA family transporter [Betaproteobacteria bacterium]|nr:EamA family transporter [Betaproteobacteria bacterium]